MDEVKTDDSTAPLPLDMEDNKENVPPEEPVEEEPVPTFETVKERKKREAAEAKALRAQVKEAQAKLRAQRDYKKKLAADRKKLNAIEPPPDVKLPASKRKREEGEEDEEDEDEEDDEDEVEGFAKSLRAYMDRYVVESLDSYRRDARKAAIDAADREGTFAETIPVPPPPPKVKPKAEDVRARSGPAIFFA